MCPSPPLSLSPPPPETIGCNWNDEELVTCLDRMICGDPVPANVRTEVNPYDVSPWLLSDDVLYFNSYDLKATETGYWKATEEDCKIFTNCTMIGSRTTLHFFTGQAPNGKKTNWMMHAYRIDQERLLEINKGQDPSSLCRVFLLHCKSPNHEQQQQCGAAGEHDVNDQSVSLNHKENNEQRSAGEHDINGKSVSLNSKETDQQSGAGGHDVNDTSVSLQFEETNQDIIHPTSRTQVISRKNEHESLAVFEKDLREPNPDYPTEDLYVISDLSEGDFFELHDLDDSLSSRSENSSCQTMSSDDYFDPNALLKDIEADQERQRKSTDNMLSVPGALRPTPVTIREDSSGAEQRILDELASNDVLNMQNVGDVNEGSPKSSENEVASSGVDQAAPAAAENDAIVGRSSSRMTKLKNKYWCCKSF